MRVRGCGLLVERREDGVLVERREDGVLVERREDGVLVERGEEGLDFLPKQVIWLETSDLPEIGWKQDGERVFVV